MMPPKGTKPPQPGTDRAAAVPELPGQVLRELADIALGRKDYPIYDKNGEELWQKPAMTARLKALELLGKHYELFGKGEQQHPDGTVEVEVRVEGE